MTRREFYRDRHEQLLQVIADEVGVCFDANPENVELLCERMHVSRKKLQQMFQNLHLSGQLYPTVKTPHQRWVVLTDALINPAHA